MKFVGFIVNLIFIIVQLAKAQDAPLGAGTPLRKSTPEIINASQENSPGQIFSSPYEMSFAQWEKNLEAWTEHFKSYTELEIKCKNQN